MQSISYLLHVAFSLLPLETMNLLNFSSSGVSCSLELRRHLAFPIPEAFSLDRCLGFEYWRGCTTESYICCWTSIGEKEVTKVSRVLRVRWSETLTPNASPLFCFFVYECISSTSAARGQKKAGLSVMSLQLANQLARSCPAQPATGQLHRAASQLAFKRKEAKRAP